MTVVSRPSEIAATSTLTESQRRWIECVVGMCERRDGHYMAAHWTFCRKVLHEPQHDAIRIAARFQAHPLTEVECVSLAEDWFRCEACGGRVDGGVELCEHCTRDGCKVPA